MSEGNEAPKKKRAPRKPQQLFVLYKGNDVDIVDMTKDASAALAAIAEDREIKFKAVTL